MRPRDGVVDLHHIAIVRGPLRFGDHAKCHGPVFDRPHRKIEPRTLGQLHVELHRLRRMGDERLAVNLLQPLPPDARRDRRQVLGATDEAHRFDGKGRFGGIGRPDDDVPDARGHDGRIRNQLVRLERVARHEWATAAATAVAAPPQTYLPG